MMKPELESQRLNAFVDGELDLARQLEIEAQLVHDARLQAEVLGLQRLRAAVRRHADYHAAPAALRSRIFGQLVDERPAARRDLSRWFAWRPLALSLTFVALLAWGLGLMLSWPSHDERVLQDAIASHVRATLSQRLVDVASSDRHTVKPWLSSRLDFSPPVQELRVPGMVFVGGRIDYLDGHPVAALVYRQRDHIIDVFVWPSSHADDRLQTATQRGFNVAHHARGGMTYWLVSDLNRDELASVARSLDVADAAR